MTLSSLLVAYIIGGITFIPSIALILGTLAYFAFTTPIAPSEPVANTHDHDISRAAVADDAATEKSKEHDELDTAAAYFAVCREYVPGGINGKPPERSTPAGEVLIAESPSVYQSMYRSIFERGKTQIPTIEGDKRDGKAVKKARNVFYVVLRHGHLMLFDDSEQVEVRHVVSLAHHDIDVYAGGESVPEGDLWIKRNCIRLIRKPLSGDLSSSKPFYFFSDNCSEKEDFYHALLHTQSSIVEADPPPLPLKFETPDIIKLVQNLHASDADTHSRWINAIVGRIFLAMYKTKDIENFIRAKINKKISRVPKPNLISSIDIMDIDMGDSAPIISIPRLKELTVNGDMTVEVDVKYNGGFKLQMGAVARIDLGTRFKAREVSLVMAGVLKKLSGHLLIRIKPPPSNRIWMTFETMPHIEMSIQPIVSSRQITYGVILRAIESRIREVIGETIVLPNWDDSPFLDTLKKEYRGGIFESANKDQNMTGTEKLDEADAGLVETAAHELLNSAGDGDDDDDDDTVIPTLAETGAKTLSMPSLLDPVHRLNFRKNAKKSVTSLIGDTFEHSGGASASTTSLSTPTQTPVSPPLRPRSPPGKPRNMRSNSFVTAATPLVSTEGANIEAVRSQAKRKGQKDAVEMVKEVNSKAQSTATSPKVIHDVETDSPLDSEIFPSLVAQDDEAIREPSVLRRSSEPAEQFTSSRQADIQDPSDADVLNSTTMPAATPKAPSIKSLDAPSSPAASPSHLSTAANAAKKWGWQVLNRQNASSPTSNGTSFGFGKRLSISSTTSGTSSVSLPSQPPDPNALKAALLAQPMGRGQPLPPPGQPLPGPPRSLWASSNLNLPGLKRKPVPAHSKTQPSPPHGQDEHEQTHELPHQQPPPLPARPTPVHKEKIQPTATPVRTDQRPAQDPDVFVVAAPVEDDSSPNTPTTSLLDHVGVPPRLSESKDLSEANHMMSEPEPEPEPETERVHVQRHEMDNDTQHIEHTIAIKPDEARQRDDRNELHEDPDKLDEAVAVADETKGSP